MKRARPTTKADETPEFKAFCDIWQPHMHRNDGRGAARDEFFRHVEDRGADPQDIVDGAAWFIRSGGQGEYKCHAQTWLNRCAYEDSCEKERDYQKKLADRETNVVSIKAAPLPENHFSRKWDRLRQEG